MYIKTFNYNNFFTGDGLFFLAITGQTFFKSGA
jgi:hypothetical protein